MLRQQISDIQTDIKNMETVTGFKKIVTEHQKIKTKIADCKAQLNELSNIKNALTDSSSQDPINLDSIDDTKFMELFGWIKNAKSNFDNITDIESQIETYNDAILKIKICESYLLNQKLDITKI